MISQPDGVEVVATGDEAAALSVPPLLIVDRITAFLDRRRIGQGPISWSRIGDGQSNVTYLIQRGDTRVVLRRGPRPPFPRSTHDMVRESFIQRELAAVGVAVPRILAVCSDAGVIGVPFYVMVFLDGAIITDHAPHALDTPADRQAISNAFVDTLIDLHAVDVERDGIASIGRPEGYLARQVRRFTSLWEADATRDLPEVHQLSRWLIDNQPITQRASVVHGDYRLGNVMFGLEAPSRVLAILDWEMATLGDPLADLGYLAATHAEPGSPANVLHLTTATQQPGFPGTAQLIERYARGSGLDVSPLPWYQTLALWKAAIFCEAIYRRWLKGERPGDEFGPRLEYGVPALLDVARAQASSRR